MPVPNTWALGCLEAAHVALVANSTFKACTVIGDPTKPDLDIEIISTAPANFPDCWLEQLKHSLTRQVREPRITHSLDLVQAGAQGQSNLQEVEDEQPNVEEEEAFLAMEIDLAASSDPDILALRQHGESHSEGDLEDYTDKDDGLHVEVDIQHEAMAEIQGKRQLSSSEDESDSDIEATQSTLHRKRRRTVMDCVLILPFDPIPTSVPEAPFPFVLSSDEWAALPPLPAGAGVGNNEERYLQRAFRVDLDKVSGRTRKWTGEVTRRRNSTKCLAVVQNKSAVPATNTLSVDPDLAMFQCKYMPDYDIVICQNLRDGKLCSQGIPLLTLMAHCYNAHAISFCKKVGGRYSKVQQDFVHRLLSRYPNIVVTSHELREVRMRPNQFGALLHIQPPTNGFCCLQCDFAVQENQTSLRVLQYHEQCHGEASGSVNNRRRGQKPSLKSRKFLRCQVQSFNAAKSCVTWLVVPPPTTQGSGSTSQASSSASIGTILAAGLALNPSSHHTLDDKVVLPFLRETGAAAFAKRIDPLLAVQLVSLPQRQERKLYALQQLATSRFRELCQSIIQAPMLVRRLLVKPQSNERPFMDKFNCPTRDSTIAAYALEEIRLLCLVLRCIEQQRYRISPKSPWDEDIFYLALTADQFKSFEALRALLDACDADSMPEITDTITSALGTLYMPNNRLELLSQPYLDPVNVYTCLRSIDPAGGFRAPKLLTTFYSKTQFGLRLFLMDKIEKDYESYCNEQPRDGGDGDPYDGFMKQLKSFLETWASQDVISPLATLRSSWIRPMSLVARKAPSNVVVMWDTSSSFLSVNNHTVAIAEYKHQIQSSLRDLVAFVDTHILCDISFPDEAGHLPSIAKETYDTQSPGHGLFMVLEGELASGNHPGSIFLAELCSAGVVCQRVGDEIIWDSNKSFQWLVNVDRAWSDVLILLHMLSLPARGTEMTIWQHANTVSSSRHLFMSSGLQTLVTVSNYSKSTPLTGLYKHILRVVPHDLATVITKLLRIVRPVQAFATKSLFSPEDHDGITQMFNTYMFTSFGKVWSSQKLSDTLRQWFMEKLNVPFGINPHRHFAQALQRKFLSYRKTPNPLEETANKGLGHGQEAADINYARQKGDLDLSVSERELFETVGSDWISWHGITVSPA